MGDFKVTNVDGQLTKNGGNVASYFLTPNGQVIHAVTGPVAASVLVREAKWAIAAYADAQRSKSTVRRRLILADAHDLAQANAANSQDRQVHRLLTQQPLAPLPIVYQEIFEQILGQTVSDAHPRLLEAAKKIQFARKTRCPVLFVVHREGEWDPNRVARTTRQVLNEFVVVPVPQEEAAALSQLTGQPPFESPGPALPLFIVANSRCEQRAAIAGWNHAALDSALAMAWINALEENPPGIGKLIQARSRLRNISPEMAARAELLIDKVRETKATKRYSSTASRRAG